MSDVREQEIREQEVRERAYELYLRRACEDGFASLDWFNAEQQLLTKKFLSLRGTREQRQRQPVAVKATEPAVNDALSCSPKGCALVGDKAGQRPLRSSKLGRAALWSFLRGSD